MYDESKYAAARNDPEIREISLAEAQDLLKKTDAEIARSVLELTYPFQHLLPEHRALLLPRVASYLAEKGSASTGLSVLAHGERSGEKILAVAATLKELAEKNRILRGNLRRRQIQATAVGFAISLKRTFFLSGFSQRCWNRFSSVMPYASMS